MGVWYIGLKYLENKMSVSAYKIDQTRVTMNLFPDILGFLE